MKNFITKQEWLALEEMLMKMQIPYSVSFDSHVVKPGESVVYDRYIQIAPIVIQEEREAK